MLRSITPQSDPIQSSLPTQTQGKKPPLVCVTGCNGYVAAELVKQLLAKGG